MRGAPLPPLRTWAAGLSGRRDVLHSRCTQPETPPPSTPPPDPQPYPTPPPQATSPLPALNHLSFPRACCPIVPAPCAGEEVTQSYFPLPWPLTERQQRCRQDYGFECACPRCKARPSAAPGPPACGAGVAPKRLQNAARTAPCWLPASDCRWRDAVRSHVPEGQAAY